MSSETPASQPSVEMVSRLVAGHREFLSFLSKRVYDRETAEEILQAAFVRTLEKADAIRDSEAVVAWFYRLLRNSIVDHHRRAASEAHALAKQSNEPSPPSEEDLQSAVCECVHTLLPNLKTEYADILRRVDLDQVPIGEVATALGISTNNATVRLHRARQALHRELIRCCGTCATHGCLDCTCTGACGHGRE